MLFVFWKNSKSLFINFFFGLAGFIFALSLSWLLLAKTDFLYSLWYDYTGLAEGIETFAPLNRYKMNFEDTTRQERLRLFSEINQSVHNHGKGLSDIVYVVDKREEKHILLRKSEVQHLQDVASLIDFLRIFCIGLSFVWLLWALYLRFTKQYPALQHQMVGLSVFLALMVCVVLFLGAKNTFYQLHQWVFPQNHQWFFYYEESLMSTLMMAPTLFGYIVITLLFFATIIFLAVNFILQKPVHK